MTDLKALWHSALDDLVERTTQSTGRATIDWRTVGRGKSKPNGEDLEWWREDGLRQLDGYAKWLDTTDYKFLSYAGEPAIEFPFVVELAGVTVRGFIDAVMVTPDGEVVVIDHKTGSRTPDSVAQLGIYSTALELLGYTRPSLGAFWMTRKGEMTEPESLDRYSIDYFKTVFAQFSKAVGEDIFIPNPGSHCRGCSVRDACYIAGGTSAWKYDPLHPQFRSQDTHKEDTAHE